MPNKAEKSLEDRIYLAIENGLVEEFASLLPQFYNPNEPYFSSNFSQQLSPLLFRAVNKGNLEIVKILLTDKRVNPNITFGEDFHSALTVAALNGYVDIVNALLEHPDIKVDHESDMGTAYAIAIEYAKISPKAADVSNVFPFTSEKYSEIAKQLLDKKANPNKVYTGPSLGNAKHLPIIRTMYLMGYSLDEKGVCFGVTHMGIQALLAGGRDENGNLLHFQTFKNRIAYLRDKRNYPGRFLKRIELARQKRINLVAAVKPQAKQQTIQEVEKMDHAQIDMEFLQRSRNKKIIQQAISFEAKKEFLIAARVQEKIDEKIMEEFSAEQLLVLDLPIFFEGVALHQFPTKFSEFLPEEISAAEFLSRRP